MITLRLAQQGAQLRCSFGKFRRLAPIFGEKGQFVDPRRYAETNSFVD